MEDHILSYKKYLQKAIDVGNVVYDNVFDVESKVVEGLKKNKGEKYEKLEQLFYDVEEILFNEIRSVEKRLKKLKKPKEATLAKKILQKMRLKGPEKTKSWVVERKEAKALTELAYLSSVMLQTVYEKDRYMSESGKLDTSGNGLLFLKHYPEIMKEFDEGVERGVNLDPKIMRKIEKISNIEAYEWLENAWKMDKE